MGYTEWEDWCLTIITKRVQAFEQPFLRFSWFGNLFFNLANHRPISSCKWLSEQINIFLQIWPENLDWNVVKSYFKWLKKVLSWNRNYCHDPDLSHSSSVDIIQNKPFLLPFSDRPQKSEIQVTNQRHYKDSKLIQFILSNQGSKFVLYIQGRRLPIPMVDQNNASSIQAAAMTSRMTWLRIVIFCQ